MILFVYFIKYRYDCSELFFGAVVIAESVKQAVQLVEDTGICPGALDITEQVIGLAADWEQTPRVIFMAPNLWICTA